MSSIKCILAAGALATTAAFGMTPAVSAAPLPTMTKVSEGKLLNEQVRYRGHRGYRGHYGGRGRWIGPAIAGGILAGALLAPRYYYGGPRYYGYTSGPRGYYADDDAVAYCMRRFRSYDPRSGTYLGYDGYRHACP